MGTLAIKAIRGKSGLETSPRCRSRNPEADHVLHFHQAGRRPPLAVGFATHHASILRSRALMMPTTAIFAISLLAAQAARRQQV
jgi:hypothetical protein